MDGLESLNTKVLFENKKGGSAMSDKAKLIVTLIVNVVVVVNTTLTAFGVNPLSVSETVLYQGLTALSQVLIMAWDIWKNCNFTSNAQKAQAILDALKGQDTDAIKALANGLLADVKRLEAE